MSELYFNSRSELVAYLQSNLNFSEDDAEDFDDGLFDYEEESYKRSTRCSGYIHNQQEDKYYCVRYLSDYNCDYSDFILDTTPHKREEYEEYEETVVVKKVKYTEVKE